MGGTMSIPIPNNLIGISKIVNNKKNLNLEIICSCGCNEFHVYKNIIIKSENQIKREREFIAFVKRCRWRSYKASKFDDGILYAYRKNCFGKIVDKVPVPGDLDDTEIIKVKCRKCGKEHILFDSRFNGYDSIDYNDVFKDQNYKFRLKKYRNSDDNFLIIGVAVSNENTLEDFINAYGRIVDNEFYSNAYSWIMIVGFYTNQKGKKTIILDRETR
jgi:hypothetical protein